MAQFKIMESKRNGTCNRCRGPISAGQLIEWNRNDGARHYAPTNPDCSASVATADELKAYEKDVVKSIREWSGEGSFRPMSYGEWVDTKKVVRA